MSLDNQFFFKYDTEVFLLIYSRRIIIYKVNCEQTSTLKFYYNNFRNNNYFKNILATYSKTPRDSIIEFSRCS